MPRWKENLFYRILSVLLAVGLWWYVTDQQNPVTEQVLNVPMEVRGITEQLVVAEKPASVQVRVQGNKRKLQEISSRDLDAWVSFKQPKAGEKIVQVEVSVPSGVELVNVYPSQARIVLDKITQVQLPVTVNMDMVELMEGYKYIAPAVTPSHVLVSGPENALNEIEELFVQPIANKVMADISGVWPIQVRNGYRENLHNWLEVMPSTISVFIQVIPELPSEIKNITVPISGEPPEGFIVSAVSVTPETIAFYAPDDLLEGMHVIHTKAVDVSEMEESQQFWVELDLPGGTHSSVGKRVQVFVEISKEETVTNE